MDRILDSIGKKSLSTMSWELWKHPDPVPGVRPMFFKPKLYKESKNGFKTINYRPSPVMFFSKNCFWSNKIIKKIGCFVDFCIFMAIYMDKLDQLRKFNCRRYRISWNITKMLKTEQFFICDFLFLKFRCFLAIIATIGFSRLQTPDFQ